MHGKDAIIEEVLDWQPVDYVTRPLAAPDPGRPEAREQPSCSRSSTTAGPRRDARRQAALGEGSGDRRAAPPMLDATSRPRMARSSRSSRRRPPRPAPRRRGAAGAGAARAPRPERPRARSPRRSMMSIRPAAVRRLVRGAPSGAAPHEEACDALPAPDLRTRSRPRTPRPRTIATADRRDYDAFTQRRPRPRAPTAPARRSSRRRPRRRSGSATARRVTTDGPFAETKEALGGFYLIEAAISTRRSSSRRRSPARERGLDRGPPDLGATGRVRDGRGVAAPRPTPRSSDGSVDRASTASRPRRRRPPLPRGAGPGRRDADPRPRRLRPRRGGGPGRVHHRTRDAGRSRRARTTPAPGSPRPPATGRSTGSGGGGVLAEKAELLGRQALIEEELRGDRSGRGARGRRAMSPIVDDRLRLIFTCCHPALPMDARVALTLRTLGGLSTPEIARAFLVPEPTLAQRLVRAKRKIRDAGHPVPRPRRRTLCRSASTASSASSTWSSTRATARRPAIA